MEMFNAEHLQEKWDPILSYDGAPKIQDAHRKMVTAVLLENQEKFLREQNNFLYEASPSNSAASSGGAFGGTASSASGSPTAGFDLSPLIAFFVFQLAERVLEILMFEYMV